MTIPSTMKAIVLEGHGGLDKLVWHEDWPTPRPGPGEVLIKVGACGMNNTDVNTRSGWYSKTVSDATHRRSLCRSRGRGPDLGRRADHVSPHPGGGRGRRGCRAG